MLTPKSIRRSAPAVVLALAGMGVFVPPAPSAHAASALPALIATAERNTNTVRTLVHHDQMTITAPGGSIRVSSHGTEDEVRNREQDYESVHVTRRAAGGKINTLHYTVDLIFMNGLTYYRTSSAPTQWKSQKGMMFPDPYTRGWKRGRTTVTFPATSYLRTRVPAAGRPTSTPRSPPVPSPAASIYGLRPGPGRTSCGKILRTMPRKDHPARRSLGSSSARSTAQ